MRRAARRDDNERDIIDALEAAGWGVQQIDEPGFPDLVVSKGDVVKLIEVIGEAKAKKYRRTDGLTPIQVWFWEWWPGVLHKVRSVEEALAVVQPNRGNNNGN